MAANPTLLSIPIAENGTKNLIPENQATPGNGLMSQSTGFPAECSLPLGAGGVAPDRADFNGAFNLLSGVAFMAQKGFTFNYDATQDYYTGCVVIDGGNRYLCIADMAAGTVAPSADTTGDYWIFYPVGVINKRDVVTTSGTYTAPVAGWYKITIRGGGGGGGGGQATANVRCGGGGGGGEGGLTIAYEYMTAGQTAAVTIGAGGSGGAANNTGGVGGSSLVVVNGNTYTGGGGYGGSSYPTGGGGAVGGTGTIPGAAGSTGNGFYTTANVTTSGGAGGGENGGSGGNAASGGTAVGGTSGGNGYAWFEFFAEV